jgi:hypothetical protein
MSKLIYLTLAAVVGCASNKPGSTQINDWSLVYQAQSSLLIQVSKSGCKIQEDRELSRSTLNAFLSMKVDNIIQTKATEKNTKEILLEKDSVLIKFVVKANEQGCKSFDLWRIVQ